MKKNLVLGLLVAFAVACNVGCATLARQGVLTPGDVQALCADSSVACSAAVLVGADDSVRKACAAIALVCGVSE